MSVKRPKAEVARRRWHFRYVPNPDMRAALAWDEIDLERKLIRVPAGRVKNKSGHTVPLSAPALAIVQSIPQREGHGNLFGAGLRPFSGFSATLTPSGLK
jgi:integrase